MCVQSLDGCLTFFEQESFAFSRFLPNFLIPGAIAYTPQSDSFIVGSSNWSIESYRYQVLAIAKSEESGEVSAASKARKVTPDWCIVINESANDIRIASLDKYTNYIVVIGERNLYVLKENGILWFMKKFDFNPSCMFVYPNDSCDSLMLLIATHNNNLLVYANDVLKWAAQLPFVPVAMRKINLTSITGALVCLSDEGHLCCSYLGTNPSVNVIPIASQTHIASYAEAEQELQELRRIINAFNSGSNVAENAKLTKADAQNDVAVHVHSMQVQADSNGYNRSSTFLSFKISLETQVDVSNIKITFSLPTSFSAEPSVIVIQEVKSNAESDEFVVEIHQAKTFLPSTLKANIVTTYIANHAPRVVCKSLYLPLSLIGRVAHPVKDAEYRLTLDLKDHQTVNISETFADLLNDSNDSSLSAIGIDFGDNNFVSVSALKNDRKISVQSDAIIALSFVSNELIRRLKVQHIAIDNSTLSKNSLFLEELFDIIDQHLALRLTIKQLQDTLAKHASEFRSIQKRLLIKLKDRNPTPLNNLDLLLKVKHFEVSLQRKRTVSFIYCFSTLLFR